MIEDTELAARLAMALAIGLLIGAERGWHERGMAEGSRVAGLRTFALIGLLGGLWMLIGEVVGEIVLGFAFAGFVALVIVAHLAAVRRDSDLGATTAVAALVTFALGALAVAGELALAASAGVVTALLLSLKPVMHDWLERISGEELLAALKLLVMSVVLLPVLPDRGYGPFDALNPYRIWWMVVLIAGVSFLGYVAARLLGPRRGIVVAGACGGLASSTAVNLTFARFSKDRPALAGLFAGGAVLASATMFFRLLAVLALAAPTFAATLALPLAGAGLGGLAAAAVTLQRHAGRGQAGEGGEAVRVITNPFELATALKFGLLLAGVTLAAHALGDAAGAAGIFAVAIVSGLADVDAISLTMAGLTDFEIDPAVPVLAVLLATSANTMTKSVLLVALGHRSLRVPALAGAGAILAGGAAGTGLAVAAGWLALPGMAG